MNNEQKEIMIDSFIKTAEEFSKLAAKPKVVLKGLKELIKNHARNKSFLTLRGEEIGHAFSPLGHPIQAAKNLIKNPVKTPLKYLRGFLKPSTEIVPGVLGDVKTQAQDLYKTIDKTKQMQIIDKGLKRNFAQTNPEDYAQILKENAPKGWNIRKINRLMQDYNLF